VHRSLAWSGAKEAIISGDVSDGGTQPKVMAGVRVLEVAAWTYVPSAGAVLAEWGADVIKIEHPETGDPQRGLITSGLVQAAAVNTMVELPNRGKRSVGLDLKSQAGRQVLMELAATSDVFLTNFLPPAREALGIEVDDLRKANPDIIYVRGSGQGQRGPERDRGGYDGSAFWARSIADIATGGNGGWPVRQPGPAFGDLMGGMTIAGGIAAALFHRERTGRPTVVDNSLLQTAMWATGASLLGAGVNGAYQPQNPDRRDVPNPVVNTYRTGDDRYLTLVMLQSDRYWDEFVTKSGHPELATDPRFSSATARYENRQACVDELDAMFATRSLAQWRTILSDIEGVWAPVLQPNEVLADPQVRANGYLREIRLDDGCTFEIVAGPIQFDETPPDLTRAPDHGEHTDAVLAELGYDTEQILQLKIDGAVL
jgi:crotonobetainyl-CoA:carnitine CoA-transferase CaiB-like acyl-CoA transferase